MDIQIKKFLEIKAETFYQILKLRVDVFVVEQNCPYPEIDNLDQSAVHLFIEQDDFIKGYLRLYFRGPVKAVIGRVVTHPDYRKDGIGRLLVQKVIEHLTKETKIQFVFLQSQEYLQPFYESFGFKAISDNYLEDDILHVDMEIDIR